MREVVSFFTQQLLNEIKGVNLVTIVAVVAGLVEGSPATVVPGVHRVTLTHRQAGAVNHPCVSILHINQ